LRRDFPDKVHFGLVYVAVGVMFQQVLESENPQFLFKHIGTLGPYPFEVFDWIGQYGRMGADDFLKNKNTRSGAIIFYRVNYSIL
jgi:hypothetical protein